MKWIKENWLLLFLAIIIFIAGLSTWNFVVFIKNEFGSFFPLTSIFFDDGRSEWGAVGDFFGGILNPFFAFLGLIMLLVTLFQNQKELSLSRKEFSNSAKSLDEQAKTQKIQQFESTFFSLLDQHNPVLNSIESEKVNYSYDGQPQTMGSEVSRLKRRYFNAFYTVGDASLENCKEDLLKNRNSLNQYFRILYQVLKFIVTHCPSSNLNGEFSISSPDKTKCSKEEKVYANIVRSFISEDVYFVLAVNCFCKDKNDEFYKYKMLVERYSFFEHMKIDNSSDENIDLINEILESYDRKVFGDQKVGKLI